MFLDELNVCITTRALKVYFNKKKFWQMKSVERILRKLVFLAIDIHSMVVL